MDELTARQKATFIKLAHAAQIKTPVNKLITDLQRQKEKFPKKTLQLILLDIGKTDEYAQQVYRVIQQDFKTEKIAIECLQRFLTAYEKLKCPRKVSGRHIETITEDEESLMNQRNQSQSCPIITSPTNSSGNEQTISNGKNISNVEASVDGINETTPKSAIGECIQNNNFTYQMGQNKLLPTCESNDVTVNNITGSEKKVVGATKAQTSIEHEYIQNNNITDMTDKMRTHSQLFFNKTIIDSLPTQISQPHCAARSIAEQEQILIKDLLYCFIGIPGDYITPQFTAHTEYDFTPISFKISDQIDVSLRNIAQDILPMASHFSVVQRFSQWNPKANNQTLQALSEILQNILNDYRVSVTQLEKEHSKNVLNLHKLLYLVRPNMQTLHILSELVEKIIKSDLQGGSILSLLFDEITLQTGDQMSQKMLIELTERASLPYIEMLERWILKGVIIDPYHQFFVTDNGHELGNQDQLLHMVDYDTARYWECQYTIRSDRIPRFLENDADIILRTGKYLNVIRQCGKQISPPTGSSKLEFSAMNHKHSTFIKQAYHNASKTLLELFLDENNLMGHISSVKRYFLLQQGDLITQFMDASEEELSKNVDSVRPVRLDNLLQLIVRLSSAKNDPCIDHLFCDIFTMDLIEQVSKMNETSSQKNIEVDFTSPYNSSLSGLECFAFGYKVEWPVSIILNPWSLSQYQMLFRLLFYCKHVERQLCKVWIEMCGISKGMSKENKTQWRIAFALRQRMFNAIQHLENYMLIEIIEPNWHAFTERMKNVRNIDEVIIIHQDFLHVCLQNCCLNHLNILRPVISMCGVCLNFAKFIQRDAGINVSIQWQENIKEYGKQFDTFLFQLLNSIKEMTSDQLGGAKLVNLVHAINFNSYYNENIEENGVKNKPAQSE